MNTIYDQIKFAIENKKQVSCFYKWLYRECCPHALWLKNWKHNCIMYQFWWDSSKWKIILWINDNWRCMELENISNLKIVDWWDWYTKDNHSHPSSCIDNIEVEVNY